MFSRFIGLCWKCVSFLLDDDSLDCAWIGDSRVVFEGIHGALHLWDKQKELVTCKVAPTCS